MVHPKTIGDRTTLAAMLALHDAGFAVFLPFGENVRCDLVIDDGKALVRIQCKTGRLRKGAVRFSTCSTCGSVREGRPVRRAYDGEIDRFAVYCPETGGVYLIPIEDLGTKVEAALRVVPARNGQAKRIRMAACYEIGRVALTSTGLGTHPSPG